MSIICNLYVYSTETSCFIVKTKASKLSKIPNIMGQIMWKTQVKLKKKIWNFKYVPYGCISCKNPKIVNFLTCILIIWEIFNLYAHTTKIKKFQFLNPIYRLRRFLAGMTTNSFFVLVLMFFFFVLFYKYFWWL